MSESIELQASIVRRVKDADGAKCRDCSAVYTDVTEQTVPWTWRQSQRMHESGTGHRMDLFAWVWD